MHTHTMGTLLLTCLVAGALAPAARADPPLHEDPRELGGHLFLPSDLIDEPFLTRYAASLTSVTYQRGTSVATGMMSSIPYVFTAIGESVALQRDLFPWLAVRGGIRGDLLLTGPQANQFNTDFTYAITAGLLASRRVRNVRIGASLDGTYQTLDLLPQFDHTLGGNLTGALLLGAGLNPAVGLLFEVRYFESFVQQTTGVVSQGEFRAGGALSVDLGPVSRVPFGFICSYRLRVPAASGPTPEHDFSAGLFYTRRPDLLPGVHGDFGLGPIAPGQPQYTGAAVIDVRYFF